jgi:hypothetical protein
MDFFSGLGRGVHTTEYNQGVDIELNGSKIGKLLDPVETLVSDRSSKTETRNHQFTYPLTFQQDV